MTSIAQDYKHLNTSFAFYLLLHPKHLENGWVTGMLIKQLLNQELEKWAKNRVMPQWVTIKEWLTDCRELKSEEEWERAKSGDYLSKSLDGKKKQ